MSSFSNDLVSIVIATYNRSNVLKYAIQSVLNQSYTDWELIIVGDCCTDNTREVVECFKNTKIVYVNLKENVGEQSGPNNYGVSIANGNYIAFLNHDDLWLPNHLEALMKQIKAFNADLVYSLYYPIPVTEKVNLISLRWNNSHDLIYGSPASTWLFKKNLHTLVGPWRFYKEIFDIPSQDWLRRVSKSYKIIVSNELTVIAIQSGARVNSYKNSVDVEHKYYFDAILENPNELVKGILFNQIVELKARDRSLKYHIFAILRNIVIKILITFGQRPGAFLAMLKSTKKGGYLDELRKTRGLPKL